MLIPDRSLQDDNILSRRLAQNHIRNEILSAHGLLKMFALSHIHQGRMICPKNLPSVSSCQGYDIAVAEDMIGFHQSMHHDRFLFLLGSHDILLGRRHQRHGTKHMEVHRQKIRHMIVHGNGLRPHLRLGGLLHIGYPIQAADDKDNNKGNGSDQDKKPKQFVFEIFSSHGRLLIKNRF